MATITQIDVRNPADVQLLRNCLLALWPDAERYLYPVERFAERNTWRSADGSQGCWLGTRQSAWTNDSWGWQSVQPNARQMAAMRVEPCEVGGWLVFDMASIGD